MYTVYCTYLLFIKITSQGPKKQQRKLPCSLPSVLCLLYSCVLCLLYSVFSAFCTLYSLLFVISILCLLNSMFCLLNSCVICLLYSASSAFCTLMLSAFCTLCSLPSVLCIHCLLYSVSSVFGTLYSVLYVICLLYSVLSAFCTLDSLPSVLSCYLPSVLCILCDINQGDIVQDCEPGDTTE